MILDPLYSQHLDTSTLMQAPAGPSSILLKARVLLHHMVCAVPSMALPENNLFQPPPPRPQFFVTMPLY